MLGKSTEFACIGDLAAFVRVSIDVDRGPAVVPPGYSALLPSGKTATKLVARVVPITSGNPGGATQYLVNGVVLWAMKPMGQIAVPGTPTEAPAWVWQ
jgi:hypothetical protein